MAAKPRQRRQERTRQEILQTALSIIMEKGADNLSLREIARRIDYSPAGLYEYFGSKEEIVDAVCNEANERLVNALQAVPPTQPIETYLFEICVAYLDFARQHTEHFLFLFRNAPAPPTDTPLEAYVEALTTNEAFGVLLRAVERGIQEGAVAPERGTAFEVAYMCWAFMHGMAILQATRLANFPYDFETVDRRVLRNFIRDLRAP